MVAVCWNMSLSVSLVLLLILSHAPAHTAALVRLVNGTHSCSGRVEVFYNGIWGTVCDDDWDDSEAKVTCREMGCGPFNEVKKGAFFGKGLLPILMNKAKCVNSESRLIDCPAEKGPTTKCDHTRDAGVICWPQITLMDGFNTCSGRVEVFQNGQWGTVCDDGWDVSDAAVVCRQVGCGDVIEVKSGAYFGQGSKQILMHNIDCVGNESTLSSCETQIGAVDVTVCNSSRSAGVICQSLTRLVNGSNSCSGRVEVYYDGRWGTVCHNNWDVSDGEVVCRDLGCGEVLAVKKNAYFGQGSGPVWMNELDCSNPGTITVRYCKSKSWGVDDCGHEKDAGIICQHPVKLFGPSICAGGVSVFRNGQWGAVCSDGWDLSDAVVLCKELSCGDVIEVKSEPITQPAVISNVNCDGSESTVLSCADGWTTQSCSTDLRASVKCRSIKVVNGPSKCSGTVQVIRDGDWATVCDSDWDVTKAQLVCRDLGCSGHAEAKSNAHFGLLPKQPWVTDVTCSKDKSSLAECDFVVGSDLCGPESYAGVICEEVRYKFIMRIRVTGDPARGPGDPVLAEIVLGKIEEQLQAKGNFTLSWKTQSNGNIFQTKKENPNEPQ